MTKQHTPGPWVIKNYCTVVVGGKTVATCWNDFNAPSKQKDNPTVPESKVNARLIAAAPDLLEALEAMMAAFTDHVSQNHNSKTYLAFHAAALALEKARGQE